MSRSSGAEPSKGSEPPGTDDPNRLPGLEPRRLPQNPRAVSNLRQETAPANEAPRVALVAWRFSGWLPPVAAAGCAGTEVASNVKQVRSMIKEARDAGAYKCAPRELALAETNTDFTETELDQGDYFRAREHLEIADHNAREALRLARDLCAPKPTRKAKPAIGDKDGDGIKDDVDKCPNDPEGQGWVRGRGRLSRPRQ